MPPSAKCSFCALVQPPNTSSMVNRFDLGEGFLVFLRDLGIARTIEIACGDFLTFLGVPVLQIGLGDARGCPSCRRPCRRRRPAARPGSTAAAPRSRTCPCRIRADARNASFSQASSTSPTPRSTKVTVEPRAPVSSTGTFLKRSPTNSLRLVGGAEFLQRIAPGRQIIPARAAGGLRIRRDDADAGLDQIVPVLDALGIALAHQEHDRRGVGRRILRQPLLPVRGDQALGGDGVDVIGQRQRDDVGLQAVDHGARLRAGAAMRLLDLDALAGFLLIGRGERLVEIRIELARRIVGHVEQRNIGGKRRTCPEQSRDERAEYDGSSQSPFGLTTASSSKARAT